MAETRLVIVRHYEPPPQDEMGELLSRVYEKLFDADLLERLTKRPAKSKITLGENGKGRGRYESGTIRTG